MALIPSACLTCLFRLSPTCHTCLPRLVNDRPACPPSLSAHCHRLSCPLSDIAAFSRRRVTPACPTTLSLLPVLQPCNSGLSYNLVFLPVMQYVISACLTALSFLPVLHLVIPACPTTLSLLPVLRPCHSCLFYDLVTLAWRSVLQPCFPAFHAICYFCLSDSLVISACPTPCHSCLSYNLVITACPKALSFLPVLQPCHYCLS